MKKWNELSMAEKVPYIKMGIDSGITDLNIVSERYNKFAEGGDTQEDDNSTGALDTAKEIGVSMIPIYGTYLEGKKFIEDPSLENAAWLGLSLVSEVPFLKWAKLGKAAKIAKTAKKAPVLVKDISKGITKQANKDLMYHLDYGNKAGAFTKNGAYVKNGTLYPGKAVKEGQKSYTWFNEGKPYATSIKEKPLKRAIIKDKKDIPDLIRVRESTEPIGQWNGKSGFVLKSEHVTPSPVPVRDAYMYNRVELPFMKPFWLRTQ